MKPNRLFLDRSKLHVTLLLLMLPLMVIKGQVPVDFSGKWQYDKTTSKPDRLHHDFEGTEILEITQNADSIFFVQVFIREGSPDWKTSADAYKLDGKEEVKNSSRGTNTRSAKWSPDKKVLTIKNIDTQTSQGVLQKFITEDTYSLSADGKTLTIDHRRDNPVTGELKGKMMYRKK